MVNNIKKLCDKLGYQFNDQSLIHSALSHRSVGAKNNERLEFLGDAVLECIISLELYKRFPEASEGNLTKLRAYMVKGETLAGIAKELQVGDFLNLGPGELSSGGFRRESILADALEAIIAAIYLDGGIEKASSFVHGAFNELFTDPDLFSKIKDPKTYLQELLQSKKIALPIYSLEETTGEQHQQTFYVTCKLKALNIEAKGKGDTRRRAEQNAAKAALKQVQL